MKKIRIVISNTKLLQLITDDLSSSSSTSSSSSSSSNSSSSTSTMNNNTIKILTSDSLFRSKPIEFEFYSEESKNEVIVMLHSFIVHPPRSRRNSKLVRVNPSADLSSYDDWLSSLSSLGHPLFIPPPS